MAKGSRLPLTLLEGSFNINRVLLQIQCCGGGMGEQTKPVHSVPDVVDHAVKMEYLLWEMVVDWVINLIIFVLSSSICRPAKRWASYRGRAPYLQSR